MKWIKAILSLSLLLALIYALNTKFGDFPPFGKFLSPFVGFWQNAESKDTADKQEWKVKGITGEVTVLLDDNRVPHIFASNNRDLYFVQGYITAKDRLWQMEFQTHAAAGRISEIVGIKAVDYDRFQRRMGMVYGAQQSLAGMFQNPETRQMLEAYTAGINAYIDQLSPSCYPLEYKLLNYAPEPWTPLKCALLLKAMAFDLAGHSDDMRMTNILKTFGPAVVKDLFPDYPSREEPIVPVGTPLDYKPLPLPKTPEKFTADFNAQVPDKMDANGLGSNNWAVAGSKTATGYPMLANDPHLQLNLPSLWYQVQLVAPGVNVYGVSLPGAPSVIIGFNQDISWGVTNVDADVLDWYQIKFKDNSKQHYWHDNQWKPVKKVIEEIKIRKGETRFDTVYYTHHGPVVYDASEVVFNKQTPIGHAMRWIAHEKSNELQTFYILNRAKNYDEYRKALTFYTSPAQNFIYADRHQDIAIWPNGKFPLKWKNQGKFTLDGTNPKHDWQGWIPQAHNPHVKNPEQGFISSANQFSAGPDYPYYINWQFAPSDRAIRINQRLANMKRVTVYSMRLLQNDNFNILAHTVLPSLLKNINQNNLTSAQKQVYQELSTWKYVNSPDLMSPAVFDRWWNLLQKAIWADEFKTNEEAPLRYPSRDRTTHLIVQEPQAKWFDNTDTPQKETIADVANTTFKQAVTELQKEHGAFGEEWAWSKHKATSVQHIAKLPGFGKENIAIGGGRNIVNATSERHGPSWRMVVALGPEVKGYGIYPGGQSGNAGSFYYDNMIETWRQGQLKELLYLKSPQDKTSKVVSTLKLLRP